MSNLSSGEGAPAADTPVGEAPGQQISPGEGKGGQPRASRDRALFDRIAGDYLRKDLAPACSRARRRRLESSLRRIPWPDRPTLLELGCGAGFTAAYLDGRLERYVGIDYSQQLIALGRHHNEGRNVAFHAADAHAIELDEPFEVVLMIGVLHHDADPAHLLRRAVEHLVPGGWVVVNEPQPANPLIRRARRLRKSTDSGYSEDQVEISGHQLETLFEQAGLRSISVHPQGLLTTPLAEVVIPGQTFWTPIAAAAGVIDHLLETHASGVLRHLSWNLVAVGQKPPES